jgi:hypothetical protein
MNVAFEVIAVAASVCGRSWKPGNLYMIRFALCDAKNCSTELHVIGKVIGEVIGNEVGGCKRGEWSWAVSSSQSGSQAEKTDHHNLYSDLNINIVL